CPQKHYNIFLRRAKNGQCFHQPCLGCREFPAICKLVEGEIPKSELKGKKDLGFMLYDMDFSDLENITPEFFRAEMNDGIIDLTNVKKVK
ncbi:MAG: type I-E CRISPR-associated protein Cas5/CasD, partial [Oscillospiraceae bacterium]